MNRAAAHASFLALVLITITACAGNRNTERHNVNALLADDASDTRIYLVAHVRVRPESADDTALAFSTYVAATQREPGILSYHTLRDLNDPALSLQTSTLMNKAALAAHQETPHYRAFRRELDPVMLGTPEDHFLRLIR